nr:dipeptidase [Bacillota bacterium]
MEGENRVKIVDAHCDVLWKLWSQPKLSFDGPSQASAVDDAVRLHASAPLLRHSGVFVQSFAVYIPPSVLPPQRFYAALQMIDLYRRHIIGDEREWIPFYTADDLARAERSGRRVALLTLEGADAIHGDVTYLRTLYYLGVRIVGLTWNYRNEVADGIGEAHPGGLSDFGRRFVQEAAQLRLLLDVSHLSEPSFWDLMAIHPHPVIASHSNIYELRNHPRNLRKEQVEAIFASGGCIGLTFVGDFVSEQPTASLDDLLRHVECCFEWGGVKQTGFGSDFDGADRLLQDVQHAGHWHRVVEALLKRYKEEEVRGLLGENWLRLFRRYFGHQGDDQRTNGQIVA